MPDENYAEYFKQVETSRAERMRWWREARFGMFVHWGLYSQLGRHEWVMNRERIPLKEYEPLADSWHPKERPARDWARLAKQAGMQYMVMTTKHHEGFCLWDTQQTDYNAARRGPGRDLVREFVDACREFDLKIGFYYSLMDWHHPDGANCAKDEDARRRFLDFTQGLVRELCTNYGKIDILWYDVSWPLSSPELWESAKMNQMVRSLQPHIIIDDRSQLPEDFGTPEERVAAEKQGRDWEACMTFNGAWGYMPISPDWRPVREVITMLNTAAAGQGNLLLNIGPTPDGSIPPEASERLRAVGQWVERYGEAMYGAVERTDGRMEWMPTGLWTIKGNTAYYWCNRWPGRELVIGGLKARVLRATLLADGSDLAFEQSADRLILKDLPAENPDNIAGISPIKLECDTPPRQVLGAGCVVL
ncbi:MAG: alpha-L-fucosidase [Kiritimatiellota bacterium]|nr:alpha-L-fucosidase [Kiritimatiellota bacterium]